MNDKLRVLVLDDSELTLYTARAHLENVGFEVRTAICLDAFERELSEFAPQIILTDVEMPEVSGDEFCATLKARYGLSSVPILLFSSLPESELSERAARARADGYIAKSAGAEVLKSRLLQLTEEVVF